MAEDMTLPFAKSLEGLNIRAHAEEPLFLKSLGCGYF
jgi:hypothetical protein